MNRKIAKITLAALFVVFGIFLFSPQAFAAGADDIIFQVKTDEIGGFDSYLLPVNTTVPGYNYNVDCDNDGTFEATAQTGNYTCNYGSAGTYTIRIEDNSGAKTGFPAFYGITESEDIVSFDQWGTGIWTNMSKAFSGAKNAVFTATDTPNFSQVTTMEKMFVRASKANPDTSGWDTSSVEDMSFMFNAALVAEPDTSSWDTSSVETMKGMFLQAPVANPDTSSWNTSSVEDASFMFYDATSANPNTSGWNTSAIENMSVMFYNATSANPDTSGWNTSMVTSMISMFNNATSANPDTSSWDISGVTNMTDFLKNVTIPTADYDAMLSGFQSQTLLSGVSFHGGDSTYCASENNRQSIIDDDSWTITDAGKDCAPSAPASAPDLQPASDTGPSDSDDNTSDDTPTFDVVCAEASSTITLYSDNPAANTAIGTYSCTAIGPATITASPALGDGVHNVTYTETNADGESGPSPSLALTIAVGHVDLQKTAVFNDENGDGIAQAGETITYTLRVENTGTVDLTDVTISDPLVESLEANVAGVILDAITAGPPTEWTALVSAGYVPAEGDVMNVSNFDTGGCSATITGFADITLLGGNSYSIKSSDGSTDPLNSTCDPYSINPSWQGTIKQALSIPTLTPSAVDTTTFVGDYTLTAADITASQVTNQATVTAKDPAANDITDLSDDPGDATGDDDATVTTLVTDSIAPPTPTAAPDLTDGTDLGNENDDDLTSDDTPDFDVECTEAGATINLYSDKPTAGTLVGTHTCVGVATETVTVGPGTLAEGSQSITYTNEDAAGNESGSSPSLDVTIDTTPPPAPTVDSPEDESTINDPTPTVTGSGGVEGETITVTGPNGETCTTTVDASGNWSCELDTDLPEGGPHTLEVVATDIAGNEGPSTDVDVTIDTTPPPAPTVDSPEDESTINDPTPTVTGSGGVEGETITVTGPNGETCTTTVDASGNWSCELDTDLPEGGPHTLEVVATDIAGNEGPSTDVDVTIDTTPPPAPTVDSPEDESTINDPTPTVTGSGGVEGETITVTGPNGETCTTTVDASGNWSCELDTDLPEGGPHTLEVVATDIAGNEGPSTDVDVTIDTTPPPAPTVDSPEDESTINDPTPTVTGSGGVEGETITVTGPNGETCTTTVDASGNWSCELDTDLPEGGPHTLEVVATDIAGNEGPSTDVDVTIDTTPPPAPTVDSPEDESTINDPTPTVTGSGGVEGETITVTGPNGETCTTTVDASGNWSCELDTDLPEGGPHTLEVVATDIAGNEGPSTDVDVTIDTTPPPAPTVDSPEDESTINDPTPTVTGSGGVEGETITVTGPNGETCTTTVDASGNWSCELDTDLPEGGPHTLEVVATDIAGNEGPSTDVDVTIDTTPPPAPTVDSPEDESTINDPTPTVTGSGGVEGETITVTGPNGETCTTTVDASGNWSCELDTDLPEGGPHTLEVVATDIAGNEGPSTDVDVTIDTTPPPAPTVDSPEDESTINDPTPTVTGSGGVEGETITVTGPNGETCTTTVDASGNWSCELDTDLPEGGPHTLEVVATDIAGNEGPSTDVDVTIDTTPPPAPTVDSPEDESTINDPTPTVTGSGGVEGETITVTGPNGETCTTTVDASGNWSCELDTDLPEGGPHTLEVVATDIAGNEGPSTDVDVTIDTTPPPAPTVDSPEDESTINDPTPTVTGSGGVEGETITVTGPNGETCTTTVDASGNWSCELDTDLPEGGPHTLEVVATDIAGNEGPSTDVDVTIDTTPPPAPTTAPDVVDESDTGEDNEDNVTSTSSPDIEVQCTEGDNTVTIYADGAEVATHVCAGTGTELVPDVNLPEGESEVVITETDTSGNESEPGPSVVVVVDTTPPPAPTVNGPTNGQPVTGTGEPGANVTVTTPGGAGCTAVVDVTSTWSCSLPGPEDGDDITATITDLAGNTSVATTETGGIDTSLATDSDGDGTADNVEDTVAPNGDGNGDGIPDSTQGNVTSVTNPETGAHTTLEVTNGCQAIDDFGVVSESSLAVQDAEYDYPVGLNDFVLTCQNPGDSATVTFYYDREYDTSNWVFRKYDQGQSGQEYSDITSSVTYGTADVNGLTVTTATYSVIDGGIEDTDRAANGTIVDPAGPALLATEDLAETGTQARTALIIGVVTLVVAASTGLIAKVKPQKNS